MTQSLSVSFARRWALLLLIAFGLQFSATPVHAQIDRVFTKDAATASSGQVQEISRNGVKLKTGGNVKEFSENEIRKMAFQGDPPPLTRAREFAIDGQYEQALDELKALDRSKISRDEIKADAEYYQLLSKAKLALAGRGDRKAAITECLAFARGRSNSFHFFSVAQILGDLALATGSYENALKYYGSLSKAPSTESKILSRYLMGVTYLEEDKIQDAQKAFSEVIGVDVNSEDGLRVKTLARAGQAVALAKGGKGAEGLALADELVKDLDPSDIEMSARIYNAQGASYEASGDIEGAILSYLHTHLMFSGQPDAHAQALGRLVELWPKVGRAGRAAEARQELKQRYPGIGN